MYGNDFDLKILFEKLFLVVAEFANKKYTIFFTIKFKF
jgi:hypothetical protein